MADGVIHTLAGSQVQVKFQEDSTNGLVLREIEDALGGAKFTFSTDEDLFELVTRTGAQVADAFTTLHPSDAATTGSVTVGAATQDRHEDPATQFWNGMARPNLGARQQLWIPFTFTVGGDTLRVEFVAEILDAQPDRLRVYLALGWAGAAPTDSVFWVTPLLLHVAEYTSDQYFIAIGNGMVTRAPKVDLVGVASTYEFQKEGAFEPDTIAADGTTFEFMYPGWCSAPVSAYGDRTTGNTLMLHDDWRFAHKRIVDSYDAANTRFILKHQQLAENPIASGNNFDNVDATGDKAWKLATLYVMPFRPTGDVFGEELALRWRAWALSAGETNLQMDSTADAYREEFWRAGKPRDRTDMQSQRKWPLFLGFTDDDYKGDTGLTARIDRELRLWFPIGASQFLPRYAPEYNKWNEQMAADSEGHLDDVSNAVQDLFDLTPDNNRRLYAAALRVSSISIPTRLTTIGAIWPRRPAPYDAAATTDHDFGYWLGEGFEGILYPTSQGGGRRRNHVEEAQDKYGTYRTVDYWMKTTSTIGTPSVNGAYTTIPVTGGFDNDHWNRFITYNQGSHTGHAEHLGWCLIENAGGDRYYVVERQFSPNFAFGWITVPGDVTSQIANGDVITIFWTAGENVIPGHDLVGSEVLGDIQPTSICPHYFDFDSVIQTANQPWWRLNEYLINEYSRDSMPETAATGIVFRGSRLDLTCCADGHAIGRSTADGTGGTIYRHRGPEYDQLKYWRRTLRQWRANLYAARGEAIFLDDFGPHNWLIGESDGSVRTCIRNDIANAQGSWGATPFFTTAFGDWMRMGGLGSGHFDTITGAAGMATVEGTPTHAAAIRQAIAADLLFCRKLPSVVLSTHATTGIIGTGTAPDGLDSYTIFGHATLGASAADSIASLIARIVQAELDLDYGMFEGRAARSLEAVSTATVTLNQHASVEDHDIGITEAGQARPPVLHTVYVDPANPRKLVALFINDAKTASAASFRFKPSWYDDIVPGYLGAYEVKKTVYAYNSSTTTTIGSRRDDWAFTMDMAACGVTAMTFEFKSGLQLTYKYDDGTEITSPLASDQDRDRVEDISGQGERFQFGFKTDLPDEEVEVTAVDLRMRVLGRSENR